MHTIGSRWLLWLLPVAVAPSVRFAPDLSSAAFTCVSEQGEGPGRLCMCKLVPPPPSGAAISIRHGATEQAGLEEIYASVR